MTDYSDSRIENSVHKIIYNWRQYGNIENGIDENYDYFEVGQNGVINIEEFIPNNGLLQHCCVIDFKDGKCMKVFNINSIEYDKRQQED